LYLCTWNDEVDAYTGLAEPNKPLQGLRHPVADGLLVRAVCHQ